MSIYPPVIIIGMSRSGTSLLSEMLEALGLFAGARKDRNNEALFFVRLNKWFLDQCSAGLENPAQIKYLIDDSEARQTYAKYLRDVMTSPMTVSYLGVRRYIKQGSLYKQDKPWGWKDPRNTYTLPIWLDVFPGAKVIHIHRHPVDVAKSLLVRRQNGLKKMREKGRWFMPLDWLHVVDRFVPKKKIIEMRCASIDEGVAMWEEYMAEAQRHIADLGESATEVKYEELLREPESVLERLVDFCELGAGWDGIKAAAAMANPDRAYAYERDPELKKYAGKANVKKRLKVYGY